MSTILRVIAANELKNGRAAKFVFEREGIKREGFVLRFQGKLAAYENVCPHLPMAMDSGDGDFFTRDGQHLICATHGAVFEPLSGLCVRGPCEGAELKPLSATLRDGFIEVSIPQDDEAHEWRHRDWR